MTRSLLAIVCTLFLANLPLHAKDQPVPPAEAAARMTLPEGFQATLFAGEPDLVQPIAFTFDDRGRLWVVECLSYPQWTDQKEGHDRVLVFDDPDGSGHFKTRKVFWDKGANLSGIQVGFGGVWLCATPNLLFIPDRDGDDQPDGPPEVVLDGWDLKAKHNVFNSLTWGPDGWLYGCNGILSNSRVGKPSTPDAQRVPLNCGVWRYHPTQKVFEAVAHGTTNPWGLDFDDYGQMFITNCVIHHLWHVIPGAHFQRMYGQDIDPHSYGLLTSPADHIHWAGGDWTTSRGGKGPHGDAGGGHAHSGAMVYLGDNWPARYRNGLFTCNIHGNRVNHDTLERRGSGYVAKHAKDFLFANDPWFRGLAIQYGPDGGAFVCDWTDTGECHNYAAVDRSNGRMYKVSYGKATPFRGDLAKLSDAELVKRQLHPNDWHVRHARRLLQERAVAGKLGASAKDDLLVILKDNPDVTRRLRALWALHVIGGLDEPRLRSLLDDASETVRAWAVRLALEGREPSAALRGKLAAMAGKDASPFVRLHLASGLQRLPAGQRWPVAEGLVGHAEDAADQNLPLMIWYGIEPLAPADPSKALGLLAKTRIPLLREYLTRRLAALPGTEADRLRPVVEFLGRSEDDDLRRDVLRGLAEALRGRRQVPMPPGWESAYPKLIGSTSAEVRERALALAVLFDDRRAFEALRRTVLDRKADGSVRARALQTLVFKQKPELLPLLQGLLADSALRGPALRGLAAFADPATPGLILKHYATFTDAQKADAVQTLASRPAYALALLDALEKGRVPRRDVSAFTIRQLAGLKDKRLDERIAQVWGAVRSTSKERVALTAKYKAMLSPAFVKGADRSRGRALFARHCALCHRLFDAGGDVGPELTGSQRANIDYVLENVFDPSAVVAREYQVTVLRLESGRVLNGIVKREDGKSVTLQTPNEVVVVPKAEIEERAVSPVSMMPEGLFEGLKKDEVRDLVAYLASPTQVPLPPAPKPAGP